MISRITNGILSNTVTRDMGNRIFHFNKTSVTAHFEKFIVKRKKVERNYICNIAISGYNFTCCTVL